MNLEERAALGEPSQSVSSVVGDVSCLMQGIQSLLGTGKGGLSDSYSIAWSENAAVLFISNLLGNDLSLIHDRPAVLGYLGVANVL